MSITVEVKLLSGKTATLQAELDEKVGSVKLRAQAALGVGKGRLLDSSGSTLDAGTEIKDTSLQNGDSLTLHKQNAGSSLACRFRCHSRRWIRRDLG